MRTIITKTRKVIEESKEMLKDREQERYNQQVKFYENYVKNDFKRLE